MASRKPKKLVSKSKRVKAIARERVGVVKPARVLDEKPIRGKPKHKRSWEEEPSDDQ